MLLSGTGSAAKGTTTVITLDKAVLFALPSIVADLYYSSQANVQTAIVVYKSSVGKQQKDLVFDLTQTSPTAKLKFSAVARSQFDIAKITLVDFDNGYFDVATADIPTLTINL